MELFAVSDFNLILRLTFAVILGLAIGAERSRVGKQAGMRTYSLVSLGACLFIVMSGVVSTKYAETFVFDPLRVASQIVVGIGFLGAGVIFVQRQILTGLTTAAGLWVVAAIGAACAHPEGSANPASGGGRGHHAAGSRGPDRASSGQKRNP